MSNKCIEICDAATAVTCALVPAATRQDDAACAPQSLGTSRFRSSLAPTYYHDDLAYLVKQGCLTQGRFTPLYNARGARRFVARQLELGRECVGALRDYPSLRIAPLQWHYACLLSLRVLDEALITDLIRGPWWLETVWTSFLALLDPRPGFAAPLEAVSGEWLVDAALAEIRGEAPAPELREFVEDTRALREVLAQAPHWSASLRSMPTPEQRAQLDRERDAVRKAYREDGVAGAQALLPGTVAQTYWLWTYPEWVQATR